jgi:hypothetical protein
MTDAIPEPGAQPWKHRSLFTFTRPDIDSPEAFQEKICPPVYGPCSGLRWSEGTGPSPAPNGPRIKSGMTDLDITRGVPPRTPSSRPQRSGEPDYARSVEQPRAGPMGERIGSSTGGPVCNTYTLDK